MAVKVLHYLHFAFRNHLVAVRIGRSPVLIADDIEKVAVRIDLLHCIIDHLACNLSIRIPFVEGLFYVLVAGVAYHLGDIC